MNYKTHNNKARNFNALPQSHDYKISAFYQPSPIDAMLIQEVDNGDGTVSHRLTSDIYMLFNQKRLDRLSRDSLLNHFQQMADTEPSFAALKSKLSDDDLISVVKSRFIQSPSELLAYSRYLNSCANDAVNTVVAQSRQRVASSEPMKSSEPNSGADV